MSKISERLHDRRIDLATTFAVVLTSACVALAVGAFVTAAQTAIPAPEQPSAPATASVTEDAHAHGA